MRVWRLSETWITPSSQVVNSAEHDLFMPLPEDFDLAVMDRFACYLPGWEMPKNSSSFLTNNYSFICRLPGGSISFQFSHTNRYEEVNKRIKLGEIGRGTGRERNQENSLRSFKNPST